MILSCVSTSSSLLVYGSRKIGTISEDVNSALTV